MGIRKSEFIMGFGKVLAICLVSTVIMNVVFIFLAYTIGYGIDNIIAAIASEPMYILFVLFAPFGRAIWLNFDAIIYAIEYELMGSLVLNIAYMLGPLITAIITGRLSDKRLSSLMAMIFSALVSMLVCIILVMYSFGFQMLIGTDFSQGTAILNVILGSILNGCLYGLIALALTKRN